MCRSLSLPRHLYIRICLYLSLTLGCSATSQIVLHYHLALLFALVISLSRYLVLSISPSGALVASSYFVVSDYCSLSLSLTLSLPISLSIALSIFLCPSGALPRRSLCQRDQLG